jgi:hypothetical protein
VEGLGEHGGGLDGPLRGRAPKGKRRSLTRPDKAPAPIPDLVKGDFSAERIDQRWCGI